MAQIIETKPLSQAITAVAVNLDDGANYADDDENLDRFKPIF
jgi:hypothetical protein